jgi:hypothetical protein
MLGGSTPHVSFCNDLVGHRLQAWNALLAQLDYVHFVQYCMIRGGTYTKMGCFYAFVLLVQNRKLSKFKIPLNIKILFGIFVHE